MGSHATAIRSLKYYEENIALYSSASLHMSPRDAKKEYKRNRMQMGIRRGVGWVRRSVFLSHLIKVQCRRHYRHLQQSRAIESGLVVGVGEPPWGTWQLRAQLRHRQALIRISAFLHDSTGRVSLKI